MNTADLIIYMGFIEGQAMQIVNHLKSYPSFRPRVIVHVGAHLAEEIFAYEALSPELVVWIEGDPDLYRRMVEFVDSHKSAATRHICTNALITDVADRDVNFYHFSNDGASSSVFRSSENLQHYWPEVTETGRVLSLRSETLDGVLARLGVDPMHLDVLVLDVQGAELMCLRGAGKYLEHVKFLEVEVSTIPIYVGAPLFQELDLWITDRGFTRISDVHFHCDVTYSRM